MDKLHQAIVKAVFALEKADQNEEAKQLLLSFLEFRQSKKKVQPYFKSPFFDDYYSDWQSEMMGK